MSGGCQRPAPKKALIDPISPELVLVDPELAARVRALEPAPLWVASPQHTAVPVTDRPSRRRPSTRRAYLAVAWAAAVLTPVAALANVRASRHHEVTTAAEPVEADRTVERLLPAAVPTAVAADPRLRAVIDPASGLVRNGTAISCRIRFVGAFWCTLRSPGGRHVTVAVRRTATGVAITNG